MDAGVAAVVGAAIGGALAGLTAIGTGWFALRVARLQVASQETQSERQRRFENLRERREPRAKAYAEFLDMAHQVSDLLGKSGEETTFMKRLADLRTLGTKVAVVGPQTVADAADELRTAHLSWNIANSVNGLTDEHYQQVAHSFSAFTHVARAALEDDGTPGPAVSPPGR